MIDPAFLTTSHPLASLPLCEARLQDDARFPWIVLIPRAAGAVEIEDLSSDQRTALLDEIITAAAENLELDPAKVMINTKSRCGNGVP